MPATRELLESLRERVRRIETAGRPEGESVSLGCAALDGLLPQRGIPRGTIHEWLAPPGKIAGKFPGGHGAEVLSLIAAREACRSGGGLVVIDSGGCFYPPAAARWGIALENVIVLRPADRRDAAWGIDQALRCSAVAAVWGFVDRISQRWLRRFQLSAEQSGCVGLFVRPDSAARLPTWSESQWWCRGVARPPQKIVADHGGWDESSSPTIAPPETFGRTLCGVRRPAHSAQVAHSVTTALAEPVASKLLVPSPNASVWGGRGRGPAEDRLIQVHLARLRGGVAGARVMLQIDFQTGSVQVARRDDEANRLRLSRRLAHPTVGRKTARA